MEKEGQHRRPGDLAEPARRPDRAEASNSVLTRLLRDGSVTESPISAPARVGSAQPRTSLTRSGPFTGRRDELLLLQRLAGNAAAVAAVQRQNDAGAQAAPGVRAGRFVNSGSSQLGRPLGFHPTGPYFVNGIEIVFDLDPGAAARFSELRPRQWSGPEAVYFKTGQPLASPWRTMSLGLGTGADDPLPQSQRVTDRAVIYDDSPGVSVLGHLGHTWIHALQNFTGWVEGRPRSGGSTRRLTEVVAWHSVISVVNPDAAGDAGAGGGYHELAMTESGTGWVPTGPPGL